jgi:hypothetical protein
LISRVFAGESSLLCDPETADPFAGIFFLKICRAFFPNSVRQFIRIFLRSVVLTGSGSIVDGAPAITSHKPLIGRHRPPLFPQSPLLCYTSRSLEFNLPELLGLFYKP